jgi:excisionase family DNA binding protein
VTTTPVAYIVGLDRAGGTVVGVQVRCPHCARTHHHHRWPVRGYIPAPCTPFGIYTVDFWKGRPLNGSRSDSTRNQPEGALHMGDGEGASKYITANGWAMFPPQFAHYLEARAKITPDERARLRNTNWDAYQLFTSLHAVALRYKRSGGGTKSAVGHSDRPHSEMWLTARQAAAELNVTDRCVRKWICAKRLPATKPGAHWLIHRNDLDVYKLSE